jgi:hypothetical protein
MRTVAMLMLLTVAACDHEEPAGGYLVYPVSPVRVTRVTVAASEASPGGARDPARIQILSDKRADRPAEVIGVVDAHLAQGDEDAALTVLRRKAADLGADAVIGVDLQHGEGHKGEPIHLSGLAIRYRERPLSSAAPSE